MKKATTKIMFEATMKVEELNYFLPKNLIAQEPLEPRHSSRLLVIDRQKKKFKHTTFLNLPRYFKKGDLLVVNETRVMPARLKGSKEKTGGKVEILLLSQSAKGKWQALVKPSRIPVGSAVIFNEGRLKGFIEERLERGKRTVSFAFNNSGLGKILNDVGEIPLPPYIKKPLLNKKRYQTIFAKKEGSVAAPTAGLHFTKELLTKLEEQGIGLARVNLKISLDTFLPVTESKIEDHKVQGEFFKIGEAVAKLINQTIKNGGRIVAVGTSTVRVLETVAAKTELGTRNSKLETEGWRVKPKQGFTKLFIYPGYQFKIVSSLITNFHQPRSTPLALVAAFAGKDLLMKVYQRAAFKNYRFLSFGDAMLIL